MQSSTKFSAEILNVFPSDSFQRFISAQAHGLIFTLHMSYKAHTELLIPKAIIKIKLFQMFILCITSLAIGNMSGLP